MLSIDCQTNKEFVQIDSEDVLQFSRNEPLHLLFNTHVVNDEEDGLLSSKLRTQRERVFPWFNIDPIPFIHRMILGE